MCLDVSAGAACSALDYFESRASCAVRLAARAANVRRSFRPSRDRARPGPKPGSARRTPEEEKTLAQRLREEIAAGSHLREIARRHHIGTNTIYRLIREIP